MEINRYIQERIGNITNLFEWIDHSYIRQMFMMPNGTEYEGLKKEVEKYKKYWSFYPFDLYLNWEARQTGNLLNDDYTFCWNLYDWHGKRFKDASKVTDLSYDTKKIFYNFIDSYNKILLVVDCENTDVYRLMAAFKGLKEEYLSKIYKIMLIDGPNTTGVWKMLPDYINIPIVYEKVERILENKSLVDGTLMLNIQKEYYEEHIDAVIIASSDSDFFTVKKKVDIGFFFLTQYKQSSENYLQTLTNNGIEFCHIDDFDSTNSDFIIQDAFKNELKTHFNDKYKINVYEITDNILFKIHASLNVQEKKNYIDRYIKRLRIEIDENNDLIFTI